jgi:hypothetical protein
MRFHGPAGPTGQRRNFSSKTIRSYIGAVERFAKHFGKPPDQLGPEHIRQWRAHLPHERKLAVGTVVAQVAGLRFFFVRTLKRRFPPDSIPYPKYTHQRVPQVLSPLGHADRVYLHLSRRHLEATLNPLERLSISSAEETDRRYHRTKPK